MEMTEDRVSELKNLVLETIQLKEQKIFFIKMNRTSETFGTVSKKYNIIGVAKELEKRVCSRKYILKKYNG